MRQALVEAEQQRQDEESASLPKLDDEEDWSLSWGTLGDDDDDSSTLAISELDASLHYGFNDDEIHALENLFRGG
jgi:hypothetical protein